MACKYANVFGAPTTGAHKYRVGGFAIVDILGTVGIAYLINKAIKPKNNSTSFLIVLVILIIAGILMHKLFCVNTRFNSIIFNDQWPPVSTIPPIENNSQ
jgi:hypothetical protein